jgi:CspA family cold shock protein
MQKGTVKWFNPTKGYGFIKPQVGEKDVFVHISAVERAGLNTLNENQVVEYDLCRKSRQVVRRKSQGLLNSLRSAQAIMTSPRRIAGGFVLIGATFSSGVEFRFAHDGQTATSPQAKSTHRSKRRCR